MMSTRSVHAGFCVRLRRAMRNLIIVGQRRLINQDCQSSDFFRAKQIYSLGASVSAFSLVAAIAAVKWMSGVSVSLMYGGQGVNRYVLEILTIVAQEVAQEMMHVKVSNNKNC